MKGKLFHEINSRKREREREREREIRARRGNKFVTLTASAILEYTFVRS